jgi:hypothetical protein
MFGESKNFRELPPTFIVALLTALMKKEKHYNTLLKSIS